jgi:dihydroorotase
LTRGLLGEALSEIGLLSRFRIPGVSDGGVAMPDTVVLRNAMEYARQFGLRLWLRPADPTLDPLGVVHDSPFACVLGLRGNPAANEEIGLTRIIALVRATGARVVTGPIGSRVGVELLRRAAAERLPIVGYVAARSLVLDERVVERGPYDTSTRLHPPLRSAEDREALVDGVRDRVLAVAADHGPRAPEEKELEFERAVPGSTGLESAFAATLTALDGDLEATVHALAIAPRALLPESTGGWTLVDPNADVTIDPVRHRSLARNDALGGVALRGRVVACYPSMEFLVTLPA